MWQFPRRKPFNAVTSVAYRFSKLLPLSSRAKLKLYSDLGWIFNRLAFEQTSKLVRYDQYPEAVARAGFLKKHLRPTDVVLDLGCADGQSTRLIAPLCERVIGIDHNAKSIAVAREQVRGDNVQFLQADASEYVRSTGTTFDVMCCTQVLEHLDSPAEFLMSFRDYFDSILVELPDNDSQQTNRLRELAGLSPIYSDDDHVWEFTRASATSMIEGAGYRIVDAEYSFSTMRLWAIRH